MTGKYHLTDLYDKLFTELSSQDQGMYQAGTTVRMSQIAKEMDRPTLTTNSSLTKEKVNLSTKISLNIYSRPQVMEWEILLSTIEKWSITLTEGSRLILIHQSVIIMISNILGIQTTFKSCILKTTINCPKTNVNTSINQLCSRKRVLLITHSIKNLMNIPLKLIGDLRQWAEAATETQPCITPKTPSCHHLASATWRSVAETA